MLKKKRKKTLNCEPVRKIFGICELCIRFENIYISRMHAMFTINKIFFFQKHEYKIYFILYCVLFQLVCADWLSSEKKKEEKKKYTTNISSAQRAKWAFYFEETEKNNRSKERERENNNQQYRLVYIAFHWLHINRNHFIDDEKRKRYDFWC